MTAAATVARLDTAASALTLAEERLRDCVGGLPDELADAVLRQMIGNVALCRGHVAAFTITAQSYARQEGKAA